jgi:hypothetical protein
MLGDALKLIGAFRDTSPNDTSPNDTLPNAQKGSDFFYEAWALHNCPVRNNPERNIPESHKNPEHIQKSQNPE